MGEKMLHLIGVGILIAIGFALAPIVVSLVLFCLPGLVGGALALGLSSVAFGGGPFVLICTLVGLLLPYWFIAAANR
jgi:hypothetical protein